MRTALRLVSFGVGFVLNLVALDVSWFLAGNATGWRQFFWVGLTFGNCVMVGLWLFEIARKAVQALKGSK